MTNQATPANASQNKPTLPFQAVIFDMDGTLLESTEADYKAWERTFEQYNSSLSYQDYLPMLGIRSADVIRNFLGFKDEADVERILMEKFYHFVDYVNDHPVKPVASAGEFLHTLAGYNIKLGLATSSRQMKTQLLLERLNFLQYFDTIVTGEQVSNGKPAPDIFLKAAHQLGVASAHCVVFEDGPIGVTAAKSAGMKCIAITATHPAEKLGAADVIINQYADIDLELLMEQLR